MKKIRAACEECEGLGRWHGSPLNSPGPDTWRTCWECGGTGEGREITIPTTDEEVDSVERV